MELDEFKVHWNNIQDKEFQQQKISPEKLEQIIMNTTETVGYLHEKSRYWNKLGKSTIRMSIGIQVVFLAVTFIKGIYQHGLTSVLSSVSFMFILMFYCMVTLWVYKRQEKIFTIYNSDNIKLTLEQTITAFKKFYLTFNVIYLFLYPAYFYAAIKLFMTSWHPSPLTTLITCALATAIALIGGHWYYKVKFFKKLKSLEENLKHLEG